MMLGEFIKILRWLSKNDLYVKLPTTTKRIWRKHVIRNYKSLFHKKLKTLTGEQHQAIRAYLDGIRKNFDIPKLNDPNSLYAFKEQNKNICRNLPLVELCVLRATHNDMIKESFIEMDRLGLIIYPKYNEKGEELRLTNVSSFINIDPSIINNIIVSIREYVKIYNKIEQSKIMKEILNEEITILERKEEKKIILKDEGEFCNRFERTTDIWEVTYNSKKCAIIDLKGMSYIALLLMKPYTHIHCQQLAGGSHTSVKKSIVGQEGLTSTNCDYINDPIDKKGREEVIKGLEVLKIKKKELEYSGAAVEDIEEIDEQIIKTKKYLNDSKYKKLTPEANKLSKAVGKNIKKAIKEIKEKNRALANHLEHSIKFGLKLVYSPEKETSWRVIL